MISQFSRLDQIWHCECNKDNEKKWWHTILIRQPRRGWLTLQGESMQYHSIHVVRRDQLDFATAQTSGSQRFVAIHRKVGIDPPMWVAFSVLSLLHARQSTITVSNTQSRTCLAAPPTSVEANAESSMPPCAGDFLYVPAWLPHQEINPSDSFLSMDRRAERFRTKRCQSAQQLLG
jgi:hypothetical protein